MKSTIVPTSLLRHSLRVTWSFLLAVASMLAPPMVFAQNTAVEQADKLELSGHFNAAATMLSNTLANLQPSAPARADLAFELDRLDRIRKDFPYTKEQLF